MTDSVTPTYSGDGQAPDTRGSTPTHLPTAPGTSNETKMPSWLFRTILGMGAAAVLVIVYFVASVTVPLMWANSIRDQIGGQLGNSIPLGMFYGFVFSFFPVVIAWQAHRRRLNKWVRVSLLALAVLLTIPNLLTLAVLFGNTKTAADARSIWANSANWFGTWSQLFMVVGVVCAVALVVLGRMWRRRGKRIREIKTAEKLVYKDKLAQKLAGRDAAKVADKQAKADARAAEKATKATARLERRTAPAQQDAGPDTIESTPASEALPPAPHTDTPPN
ncbi:MULTISPECIES: hypothetical protein [Arthrobacter]|uniref:hypothetical protein n=1 Tax=unclassified Arthrobacter TaxID=235627 RepID=UPI0024B9527C|nr:hypothetical protein [Arthrobacter sp. H35-MC1]MDJ0318200.1 hypothetical protein [Arthrobacter sp. H35-MC1]